MFHFLHTFHPESILIALGPVKIYWYGALIVLGILAGIFIVLKLCEKYRIDKNFMIDAVFWIIIGGIIGARIYHILLEWPYYFANPLDMVKIWNGGLAIHGAIFAGLVILWYYGRKIKFTDKNFVAGHYERMKGNYGFWMIAAIFTPALALAQAFGRWGNYFNQELYGLPTNLPWSIPISPAHRLLAFYNYQYFHPTFLYESIGNLIIFGILIWLHARVVKKSDFSLKSIKLVVLSYLFLYSLLRFSLEFVRIDITPSMLGLRFPQIISLVIMAAVVVYGYLIFKKPVPPRPEPEVLEKK